LIATQVQTGNDTARDFYAQFGFREIGIIRGYYKRIQPDSCYVLAKALSDGDDPAVLLAQEVPGLEAS
jgi:ribosomal protein S18 acetylase RimI-like enzyme